MTLVYPSVARRAHGVINGRDPEDHHRQEVNLDDDVHYGVGKREHPRQPVSETESAHPVETGRV
eukprot:507308-Prymnesium_polylepis.1